MQAFLAGRLNLHGFICMQIEQHHTIKPFGFSYPTYT